MCPLRVLLIFLSATLAGFLLLRSLRSQQDVLGGDPGSGTAEETSAGVAPKDPLPFPKKVQLAICSGFWTCVDMASGRYLWRNLVSSAPDVRKQQ